MENTERNTQPSQNTNSKQNPAANRGSKQPGQQTQSESRTQGDPTNEKKDWDLDLPARGTETEEDEMEATAQEDDDQHQEDLEDDVVGTERADLGHTAEKNPQEQEKDERRENVA